MSRTSRGSSFLSGALNIFQSKPKKIKSNSARKAGANVLSSQKPSTQGASHPYRAAEIVTGNCACEAVESRAGTRMLLSEVPLLPLPDCTSPNCGCSYVRFNDRRDGDEDRRLLHRFRTDMFTISGNEERREGDDRRAEARAAVAALNSSSEFDAWSR